MLRRVGLPLGQSQGFHMRVLKRKGEIEFISILNIKYDFHFVTRSIDMYKDVFDLTQTHTHTCIHIPLYNCSKITKLVNILNDFL